VDGVATRATNAHAIHNMYNGIYLDYDFEKICNALQNLIAVVGCCSNLCFCPLQILWLINHHQIWPISLPNPWHSSTAQTLLLDGMKPSQIQQSRQEYQQFPSKVFCYNKNREVYKPDHKAYWRIQKQLSEQKRQSKNNDWRDPERRNNFANKFTKYTICYFVVGNFPMDFYTNTITNCQSTPHLVALQDSNCFTLNANTQ
jgi:hypothetical protein